MKGHYTCILFIPLVIFVWMLPAGIAWGQVRLQGTVSDSTGEGISHVQVLLQVADSTSKIMAYTQTNSSGRYRLIIGKRGDYKIAFKALSYRTEEIFLNIDKIQSDSVIVHNITLQEQPISMDEVIVQAERPITIEGDTVSYDASAFRQGDEAVVEDLLEKLPGVEVSEDGQIKFQGKEVEKVMVEGSDLFGRGYRMITRNLDANAVDKVEALKHYSDSPELRGLEHSDDVALNLTLNEDTKAQLFGNATVGMNSSQNYKGRMVLMSLKKKVKHYLFLNANSLGYDPIGDVRHFMYPDESGVTSEGILAQELDPMFNMRGDRPGFSDVRTRFNHSALASYNLIVKPSKKFELKALSFATYDKDRFQREGRYLYDLGTGSFQNTESYSLINRMKNGWGRMEMTYQPDSDSRIWYEGMLKKGIGDDNKGLTFNTDSTGVNLDDRSLETSHQLQYSGRLSEDFALQIGGQFAHRNLDENYVTSPFIAVGLFNINSDSAAWNSLQSSNIGLENWNVTAKAIYKPAKRFVVQTKAGTQFSAANQQAEFEINRQTQTQLANGLPLLDRFDYKAYDFFVGSNGRYSWPSLSLYSGAVLHRSQYRDGYTSKGIQREWFLEPDIGLQWSPGKHLISASYGYNATSGSLLDLMDGYHYEGDRSFSRGLGSFEINRGHNGLFRYEYGNWLDNFLMNGMLFYKYFDRYPALDAILSPGATLYGKYLGRSKEMWTASLTLDRYLYPVKNNIKLKGVFSSIDARQRINAEETPYNLRSYNYGVEIRSVFAGWFNYVIGSSWSYSRTVMYSSGTTANDNQFVDLYVDLTDAINLKVVGERFHFGDIDGQKDWYFMDASLDWNFAENKFKMSLYGRNLLDNNSFRSYRVTDVREQITQYKLVSRYVLLSVYYRF